MSDFDDAMDACAPGTPAWALERDQRRDARWEEAVVRKLLLFAGAPERAAELKRETEALTGDARLTFQAFQEAFPQFPIWLHCHKIPYVFQDHLEQFFFDRAGRKRSRLYRDYQKARTDIPDFWGDRPFGLVFEWLHSGGQYKVFHNCPLALALDVPDYWGLRIGPIYVAEGRNKSAYWLENLESLAENLGWMNALRG